MIRIQFPLRMAHWYPSTHWWRYMFQKNVNTCWYFNIYPHTTNWLILKPVPFLNHRAVCGPFFGWGEVGKKKNASDDRRNGLRMIEEFPLLLLLLLLLLLFLLFAGYIYADDRFADRPTPNYFFSFCSVTHFLSHDSI